VMTGADRVEKVATASDEAFALLCIENYFEHWLAKARHCYMHNKPEGDFEKDVDKSERTKPGKWTSGRRNPNLNFGWHRDGVIRYNELMKSVKEDRKDNDGEMENKCMEEAKKKTGTRDASDESTSASGNKRQYDEAIGAIDYTE